MAFFSGVVHSVRRDGGSISSPSFSKQIPYFVDSWASDSPSSEIYDGMDVNFTIEPSTKKGTAVCVALLWPHQERLAESTIQQSTPFIANVLKVGPGNSAIVQCPLLNEALGVPQIGIPDYPRILKSQSKTLQVGAKVQCRVGPSKTSQAPVIIELIGSQSSSPAAASVPSASSAAFPQLPKRGGPQVSAPQPAPVQLQPQQPQQPQQQPKQLPAAAIKPVQQTIQQQQPQPQQQQQFLPPSMPVSLPPPSLPQSAPQDDYIHDPLTREVMVNAQITNCGHTFSQKTLGDWLSRGNTQCPLCGSPLSSITPNHATQSLIQEHNQRQHQHLQQQQHQASPFVQFSSPALSGLAAFSPSSAASSSSNPLPAFPGSSLSDFSASFGALSSAFSSSPSALPPPQSFAPQSSPYSPFGLGGFPGLSGLSPFPSFLPSPYNSPFMNPSMQMPPPLQQHHQHQHPQQQQQQQQPQQQPWFSQQYPPQMQQQQQPQQQQQQPVMPPPPSFPSMPSAASSTSAAVAAQRHAAAAVAAAAAERSLQRRQQREAKRKAKEDAKRAEKERRVQEQKEQIRVANAKRLQQKQDRANALAIQFKELQTLQDRKTSVETKIPSLLQRVEQGEAAVKKLEDDTSFSLSQIEKLRQQILALEKHISENKQKVEQVKKDVLPSSTEASKLKEQVSSLSTSISNLESAIQNTKRMNDSVETFELQELEAERKELERMEMEDISVPIEPESEDEEPEQYLVPEVGQHEEEEVEDHEEDVDHYFSQNGFDQDFSAPAPVSASSSASSNIVSADLLQSLSSLQQLASSVSSSSSSSSSSVPPPFHRPYVPPSQSNPVSSSSAPSSASSSSSPDSLFSSLSSLSSLQQPSSATRQQPSSAFDQLLKQLSLGEAQQQQQNNNGSSSSHSYIEPSPSSSPSLAPQPAPILSIPSISQQSLPRVPARPPAGFARESEYFAGGDRININRICLLDDRVFAACIDSSIRSWQISSTRGGTPAPFSGYVATREAKPCKTIRSSAALRLIFAGNGSGVVQVYSHNPATAALTLLSASGFPNQHHHWVSDIKVGLAGNDHFLASCAKGEAHNIKLWNVSAEGELAELATLSRPESLFVIESYGNHFFTGGEKGIVAMYDLGTLQEKAALRAHKVNVHGIVCRDANTLYTSSYEKNIQLWDIRAAGSSGATCLKNVKDAHREAIMDLAIYQDSHIISASKDGEVKLWDSRQLKQSLKTLVHSKESAVNAVELLKKRNGAVSILTAGEDGKIVEWSPQW